MKIALKGYRIIYEPDAYAAELPSFSLQDEKKRKVRIAAGGFQAIGMLPQALRFWKYPRLSFLYISHRVLRWALSPFCLAAAFVANLLLMLLTDSSIYAGLFILQALFYSSGLIAYYFPAVKNRIKLLKLAYYFIFMNISVIQGFFRFLRRKQPSTWEKAKRSSSNLLESQALADSKIQST
jgi:cellulose synthase/poly-beta-1,6-N-acetylglucosamine synthase-like glycosyltransferase